MVNLIEKLFASFMRKVRQIMGCSLIEDEHSKGANDGEYSACGR
jgi:hypothetical protein